MATNNSSQVLLVNIWFLSPVVLVFFSTLAFMICLPVLPLDVMFPITIEALFFWLTCFIGFLVGLFIGAGGRLNISFCQYRSNPKKVRIFLGALVMLGFIGTIIMFVDRYFIRGVSLAADAMENREVLLDSKASALSVIAAATSSFGILSYVLIWVAELGQIVVSRWLKLMALLSVLSAVFFSAQLGSRSLLLVVILVHLFAWFFVFRVRGGKVRSRHILMIFLTLVGLASISAIMMVSRVELMGRSMFESVLDSAYAYTLRPSHFVLEVFQDNQNMGEIFAGLLSLVQYVFHGIYEFSLLYNNFQGDHEMGGRTLWLPLKIVSMLTGGWIPVGSVEHIGERPGTFTTFVGPMYIDFGCLSPVALIVYGVLVGLPFRFLRRGQIEWLPVVVLVATCSLLWPVVNIFTSASGTYLLFGAVAIGLMGKRLRYTR